MNFTSCYFFSFFGCPLQVLWFCVKSGFYIIYKRKRKKKRNTSSTLIHLWNCKKTLQLHSETLYSKYNFQKWLLEILSAVLNECKRLFFFFVFLKRQKTINHSFPSVSLSCCQSSFLPLQSGIESRDAILFSMFVFDLNLIFRLSFFNYTSYNYVNVKLFELKWYLWF